MAIHPKSRFVRKIIRTARIEFETGLNATGFDIGHITIVAGILE